MQLRYCVCLLLLATATWLGATNGARGEINVGESIEWMVADSAAIVLGRVTEVRGTAKYGAVTATVAVKQMIKGDESLKQIRVVDGSGQLFALRGVETDMVLFLSTPPKEAPEDLFHLRSTYSSPSVLRMDGKGQGKFFDMQFQVLTLPDDVLAAAKHALVAGDPDAKAVRHQMDLPGNSAAFQELYAGSAVWFYVPANSQLEQKAHEWLAPKGEPKLEDTELLLEGARALKYFESEKNAALLKRFLDDNRSYTSTYIANGKRVSKRVYYLRKAAYETLLSWEMDVTQPVLEVDVSH